MNYHIIATRPGGRKKSIINKSEDQVLTEFVVPFLTTGTIKARWGKKTNSYQVLELQIFKSKAPYNRKTDGSLDDFLKHSRNQYTKFRDKAEKAVGLGAFRVFIVMPIQGERFGTQNEQRIFKEFDDRFSAIESALSDFNCVAIRIDKEHPLEDIVSTIKSEIRKAQFVIADLTDERPSCYFEAGYAEARGTPVIYIASKESVGNPGKETKIHFDIHMNVNFFTNHTELQQKLESAVTKNKETLFKEEASAGGIVAS